MCQAVLDQLFTRDYLDSLLPLEISDEFFEALYGDASEGAYDIRLGFTSANDKEIVLAFHLSKRPGKCLVCSLTYGLPKVFARHPRINVNGIVDKIRASGINIKSWRLGQTREHSPSHHSIPLFLDLDE